MTHPYAAGQVWTYRTRPQDEGSLVKIQLVEPYGREGLDKVFHVSLIGLTFENGYVRPEVAHAPVSRETLDASVLERVETEDEFPNHAEGLMSWREGEGGVFTITLAELAAMFDQVTAGFVGETDNLYFRTDWTHGRPDDPVSVMYEVAPDGRVLRTMHVFPDGGGVLTSVEDFEDLPQPASLVDGNFFGTWKDVPLGEPYGDQGDGESVLLTQRDPREFAELWDANRG
ncbi:MAG: hypothetical protein K1X35_05480 [Caulobacteraceae bacterium]|nr:hypothetical protein [Caulobacteraceae bacterium]